MEIKKIFQIFLLIAFFIASNQEAIHAIALPTILKNYSQKIGESLEQKQKDWQNLKQNERMLKQMQEIIDQGKELLYYDEMSFYDGAGNLTQQGKLDYLEKMSKLLQKLLENKITDTEFAKFKKEEQNFYKILTEMSELIAGNILELKKKSGILARISTSITRVFSSLFGKEKLTKEQKFLRELRKYKIAFVDTDDGYLMLELIIDNGKEILFIVNEQGERTTLTGMEIEKIHFGDKFNMQKQVDFGWEVNLEEFEEFKQKLRDEGRIQEKNGSIFFIDADGKKVYAIVKFKGEYKEQELDAYLKWVNRLGLPKDEQEDEEEPSFLQKLGKFSLIGLTFAGMAVGSEVVRNLAFPKIETASIRQVECAFNVLLGGGASLATGNPIFVMGSFVCWLPNVDAWVLPDQRSEAGVPFEFGVDIGAFNATRLEVGVRSFQDTSLQTWMRAQQKITAGVDISGFASAVAFSNTGNFYVVDSYGRIVAYDRNLTLIGSTVIPQAGEQIVFDPRGYAYISVGGEGMQIVRTMASPQAVALLDTDGTAHGLALLGGDKVAVADGEKGVKVVDITDPSNPEVLGACDTPGNAYRLAYLANGILLVADGEGGVQAVDISNPSTPYLVGQGLAGLGTVNRIILGANGNGQIAYFSTSTGMLRALNVSNPANMTLIGNGLSTGSSVYGLAVKGSDVYLAANTGGFMIVNAEDPQNLVSITKTAMPGPAYDVAIVGDEIAVADGKGGLQIVDPTKLEFSGIATTPGSNAIELQGEDLQGKQVVDVFELVITDPPQSVGTIGTQKITPNVTKEMKLLANRLFSKRTSATAPFGLEIIQENGHATPSWVQLKQNLFLSGSAGTSGTALKIATVGNYAYVAADNGDLRIFDFTDTSNPVQIGYCSLPGKAQSVQIVGQIAYLAIGEEGFAVVDISNPKTPVLKASINTPGYAAKDVVIIGKKAYLPDGLALQEIDISDPTNPILARRCAISAGGNALAISGQYAYLTTNTGFVIVNLATFKVESSRTFQEEVNAITLNPDKTLAYLATNKGVRAVDIRDPKNPIKGVVAFNTTDKAYSVGLLGSSLYVGTGKEFYVLAQTNLTLTQISNDFYGVHNIIFDGANIFLGGEADIRVVFADQWTLSYTPPERAGNVDLILTATDTQGSKAQIPFSLQSDPGIMVKQPPTTQSVAVENRFDFEVSCSRIFGSDWGGSVACSVVSMPEGMKVNQVGDVLKFSGEIPRAFSDGTFGARSEEVVIEGTDSLGNKARVNFTITITGRSGLEITLTVVGILVSLLGGAWTAKSKRHIAWNLMHRKRVFQGTQEVHVGESGYEYTLSTPKEKIVKIIVETCLNGKKKDTEKRTFNQADFEVRWLRYDSKTHTFRATRTLTDADKGYHIVTIKGGANGKEILEQWGIWVLGESEIVTDFKQTRNGLRKRKENHPKVIVGQVNGGALEMGLMETAEYKLPQLLGQFLIFPIIFNRPARQQQGEIQDIFREGAKKLNLEVKFIRFRIANVTIKENIVYVSSRLVKILKKLKDENILKEDEIRDLITRIIKHEIGEQELIMQGHPVESAHKTMLEQDKILKQFVEVVLPIMNKLRKRELEESTKIWLKNALVSDNVFNIRFFKNGMILVDTIDTTGKIIKREIIQSPYFLKINIQKINDVLARFVFVRTDIWEKIIGFLLNKFEFGMDFKTIERITYSA